MFTNFKVMSVHLIIKWHSVRCESKWVANCKIVEELGIDVFPLKLQILVSVYSQMFVNDSESVHCFVDSNTNDLKIVKLSIEIMLDSHLHKKSSNISGWPERSFQYMKGRN